MPRCTRVMGSMFEHISRRLIGLQDSYALKICPKIFPRLLSEI